MPATPQTRAMVLASASVCEDKKGENIRILELDPVDAGLSDYFLIASGNSRQTVAMADDIELRMKREFGTYARSVEGRRKGDWIVLDYVDFVVHLFTQETREYYDIERLRKSARVVTAAELEAELAKKPSPTKKPAKKAAAKMPAKAAAKAPARATAKAPAKAGTKSPAKSAVKSAAKAATRTPAKKTAAKKAPAKATTSAAKKSAAPGAAKKTATKKAPATKATVKSTAKKASSRK